MRVPPCDPGEPTRRVRSRRRLAPHRYPCRPAGGTRRTSRPSRCRAPLGQSSDILVRTREAQYGEGADRREQDLSAGAQRHGVDVLAGRRLFDAGRAARVARRSSAGASDVQASMLESAGAVGHHHKREREPGKAPAPCFSGILPQVSVDRDGRRHRRVYEGQETAQDVRALERREAWRQQTIVDLPGDREAVERSRG